LLAIEHISLRLALAIYSFTDMGHYALLDENNIVVNVITGRDEHEVIDGIDDWEKYYSEFTGYKVKRTSYNTTAGTHTSGGTPFRKNYAAIGGYYDENLDAFIHPKNFPSWVLDEETCLWEPPTPQPTDRSTWWDEENQVWADFE
jgi:hypothetical protein